MQKPSDPMLSGLRILWGHLRQADRQVGETDRHKLLKKLPFFEHLKRHQLARVSEMMHLRTYRETEFVFDVAQPGAALFIVQSGEVAIQTESGVNLAKMSRNSFFGELALLDESPRSARAVALVPTQLLALFRSDLDRLMLEDPKAAGLIYQGLATVVGQRLKATNELLQKTGTSAGSPMTVGTATLKKAS
jgi:CRP/FNR family transcriptional regulator, cyclic AMP receptor protein